MEKKGQEDLSFVSEQESADGWDKEATPRASVEHIDSIRRDQLNTLQGYLATAQEEKEEILKEVEELQAKKMDPRQKEMERQQLRQEIYVQDEVMQRVARDISFLNEFGIFVRIADIEVYESDEFPSKSSPMIVLETDKKKKEKRRGSS